MIEPPRVDQWLVSVLTGDAQLGALVGTRVYGYVAPPDTAYPFVLFSYQGGGDRQGLGTTRILADLLYQIKAVDRAPGFGRLKTIVDRLDFLLQGAQGPAGDMTVLACTRESPVVFVEVQDGIEYRHLGGLWRILISKP